MLQAMAGRTIVIENPRGSDIFRLRCFERLWRTEKFGEISFPQCALGLVVDGQPILKWTTLWSNSWHILWQFEGLECACEDHGILRGKRSTTASTVFFFLLSRFSMSAIFVISPFTLSLVNPEVFASSISSFCSPFLLTRRGTKTVSLEPDSFFKSVLTILSADCCSTGAPHL